MNITTHAIIQACLTLIQVLNVISTMLPPKQEATVAAFVAVLQALAAFVAHFSNPDGTDVRTAYQPPAKK